MKTIEKMKAAVTIIALACVTLGFGQSDYLKITRSNTENDFIKYPPGTKFKLLDENKKVVFNERSSEKLFVIDKPYVLKVNPPYKESQNTYYLNEGKVEIKSNSEYFKSIKKHDTKKKNKKDYGYFEYNEADFTKGLTMEKTMEPSTENPSLYNATFKFNNGVIATYSDGKMTATQNDKDLKIENKYIIYVKEGTIKLSFRPKTGESWWYFDTNNKKK